MKECDVTVLSLFMDWHSSFWYTATLFYTIFSTYGWYFTYILLNKSSLSQGLKDNLLYFLLRVLKFCLLHLSFFIHLPYFCEWCEPRSNFSFPLCCSSVTPTASHTPSLQIQVSLCPGSWAIPVPTPHCFNCYNFPGCLLTVRSSLPTTVPPGAPPSQVSWPFVSLSLSYKC